MGERWKGDGGERRDGGEMERGEGEKEGMRQKRGKEEELERLLSSFQDDS